MHTLHIELAVDPDDLTGTAVDDSGRTWPINGWLSLIGIIDRTRREDRSGSRPDQQPER